MPNNSLGFLYKLVPISAPLMRIWLNIPEFTTEMEVLIQSKKHITCEDVLVLMERICATYETALKSNQPVPDYIWINSMRRGRNQLRRALNPDSIQE